VVPLATDVESEVTGLLEVIDSNAGAGVPPFVTALAAPLEAVELDTGEVVEFKSEEVTFPSLKELGVSALLSFAALELESVVELYEDPAFPLIKALATAPLLLVAELALARLEILDVAPPRSHLEDLAVDSHLSRVVCPRSSVRDDSGSGCSSGSCSSAAEAGIGCGGAFF